MEKLIELVTHPIGLLLIIALVIVAIIRQSISVAVFILSLMKKSKDKTLMLASDFCVGIFLFVEKAIPDDTKNKTAAKVDLAMKKFIEKWNEAKGKDPSEMIKEWALGRFANLSYDHKLGRSLRPATDNG